MDSKMNLHLPIIYFAKKVQTPLADTNGPISRG